jgi:hypothetical protein
MVPLAPARGKPAKSMRKRVLREFACHDKNVLRCTDVSGLEHVPGWSWTEDDSIQ